MKTNIQTSLFVTSMFVMTMAFAAVGKGYDTRWTFDADQTAVAEDAQPVLASTEKYAQG